ncbi:serine/threonine-protein kinase [Synechococcus elongatus]|uniref:Serine/threonine-protein kinase B n=3 Tax=Synechococcus elongatus TaxID=32046 RepID=A0AAN1QQK2_SYNEL|nr:serine/threonine-protein kinase [Synechococcus elongatus]AZB73695.1 serine/threonine protein kinase [Synechococcus elongatus PCC 11801]QFZ92627.1 serine/threonine protein kinase [Synechococcus elongatus PCC 11802]
MALCLNPACEQPDNEDTNDSCASCGSPLLLRDRYRVIKALGQGGFGATYLGQDLQLPGEPLCVIKQLLPQVQDPEMMLMARELFRREAKTLGRIGNHPQVPTLLDYFETPQGFYLIQEYIRGKTLEQEVRERGLYSEAAVKQFLSELLPLLQYLHNQEVIHRDIKPANLLRRDIDGRLVLIDFGAVKDQVSQIKGGSGLTALTSFSVGTRGYAPPEQLAMRPVYSSDIYSLGITCLFLMTGKGPQELDYNPVSGELLWRQAVQISDAFATVLGKMLAASVRFRYQRAEQVMTALDLQPYHDSLIQGLSALPPGTAPIKPSSGRTGSGYPSPQERQAAAIRARRRDRGGQRPEQLADPQQLLALTGSSNPTTGGLGRASLNARDILATYQRGRRDFSQQVLNRIDLSESQLPGINFQGSQLKESIFTATQLERADFGQANLHRANLRRANLHQAYFGNADLSFANLQKADLSDATLSNANLRGANLCGANLRGAKLTPVQLKMAKTNWWTIMPDGRHGRLF